MTKWEYAVTKCSYESLQTVLREYGKFGEFVQALDDVRGLTIIFKRPESNGVKEVNVV